MWTYLLLAVGSFTCGLIAAYGIAVWLKSRLVKRLNGVASTLAVIAELENRRVGYDSGRTSLARGDAGRPARISEGMTTKPGRLASYLRDSRLTKKNDAEGA